MIESHQDHEAVLRDSLDQNQEYLYEAFLDFTLKGGFAAFDDLIKLVDANNYIHGWQIDYCEMEEKLGREKASTKFIIQSLFMITSECIELSEDLRACQQDYEHAIIEASDILTRTMSLVAFILSRSIENKSVPGKLTPSTFFSDKMAENIFRPFLHGEKRF